MFDIGFSELFVIAIVALLVLGPERLPKAARFAGLWVRRARAQWHSVKSELEHELAAEELKRNLRETEQTLRAARDELNAGIDQARDRLQREGDALRHGIDDLDAQVRAPVAPTDAEPAPALESDASTSTGSGEPVEPVDPTLTAHDGAERR